MLGGLCPCTPPSGKNFCTRGEYFTMSNGIFNFNFLALVFSWIGHLSVSKINRQRSTRTFEDEGEGEGKYSSVYR